MFKETANNLESLYADAIQDAFQNVQKAHETDADEQSTAQILALRQVLADCLAYRQELNEEMAIECYGDDLPDDIMPRELREAAA